MTRRPRIAIAGGFPFPYGKASTSRVLHLAAGLSRADCEVHVISIWGNVEPYQNKDDLLSDDIRIHRLLLKQELGPLTKAKLIFDSMSNIIASEKLDVLLLYGGSIDITLPLFVSAKLRSLYIVAEICEWFPSNRFEHRWYDKDFISELIYRNIVPMFSDAVLCISTHIQTKVSKYNRNTIIIPALGSRKHVSPLTCAEKDRTFKVVYSGNFKKEDAAYLLIEAIRLCLMRGKKMKLEMIGGWGRGEDEAYCKSLVSTDPLLRDSVSFIDHLPNLPDSEYWRRIESASCLVIVRPHNKANIANFPTRLPEFLWTGKPVVISSAGDIERYLKRGIHAHIIDHVSPQSLAEALSRIYGDCEYAAALGNRGKTIAEAAFNYLIYGKELASFMRYLVDNGQRVRSPLDG
jgi:glycosyltransferase involved in cell wall biosynthesis